MNVRVIRAGMVPTAPIVSTATPAPVRLASVASTVRSTPTTALTGSLSRQNIVSAYSKCHDLMKRQV